MDMEATAYVQHPALPNTLFSWLWTLTGHRQNYEEYGSVFVEKLVAVRALLSIYTFKN